MIDVLVVDDSPVIREYLRYLLQADPQVRVVGSATNGREAVEFVASRKPDVVTMDLQMPVMDGYQATRAIMEANPVPIVIVSAGWDPDEMGNAFKALEAGAVAALGKPRGIGHPDAERTAAEFVRTVKLMAEVRVVRRWSRATPTVAASAPPPAQSVRSRGGGFEVVAIGASTGGPKALHDVLSGLPAGFPAPVLIVQHIADGFLPGLADWLNSARTLPVRIAVHGETLLPGRAYLAPDGAHLGVAGQQRIALSNTPPENGVRPAVSHLFRSVAAAFGEAAVGVLLTGMGRDGAQELKLLRDRGALTIAQDRDSAVVHGMPGEAIRLGAAEYVLDPAATAQTLVRLFPSASPATPT